MRPLAVFLLAMSLTGLPARPAAADLVRLANGQTMEGIVTEETPRDLRLQIDWQGYTTLDRSIVLEVVPEGKAANQRRLAQWREDRDVLMKRQRDQAAFEAAQREKGLIKRDGEWVTPDTIALLEHEDREEEQARLQEQLTEVTGRLRALESENRELREEIARARTTLNYPTYAYPGAFIVHRQRARDHDRSRGLFRDEHGNVVRVRDHGKHKSFTAPDGTHADLQFQNGKPGFTDTTGVFHELSPLHR